MMNNIIHLFVIYRWWRWWSDW